MTKQNIIGFIILGVSIIIGIAADTAITTRIFLGLALGYVLVRGSFGFAGSVNRAYKFNSLALMRALMNMFMITAGLSAILFLFTDIASYDLWINQINLGLILGGLLFGIGMAFASCCASGVMTDGVVSPTKLVVVTLGFGLGILLGFPLQTSATWITDGAQIAFFNISDNLLVGLTFALLVTIALGMLVKFITRKVEAKWEVEGKVACCASEVIEGEYETTTEKILVKPFSLNQTAVIISVIFVIMLAVTKSGWGASTPYGFWVGKLLMTFGVDAATLGEFTGKGADFFNFGLFSGQGPSSVGIQNIFIFIGGCVAALTMNKFNPSFKLPIKQVVILLVAGVIMGFGTRLANGCNVGALYTPIANFSLSGWIFLIPMIVGGVIGNMISKKIN
ncbi:YeeE/YedE thiosulfate transporter family protein [Mollicutes bacterium LVI A0078]|nr:YeeE/YedE thiosulfate transporter family protein [Mollicutes bacterium LVI A0075]WOO90678.1 YeeE/YedE thiosulfate transporter family protein [Mollicutes bacterium LVI A0078]